MSQLTDVFTDIANSLRSKLGTSVTYKPTQFAATINSIPSGGGGGGNDPIELKKDSDFSNSFNYPVEFNSESVNVKPLGSYSACFASLAAFNQPITLPYSIVNAGQLISNCSNFNQPVTIGPNVTYMGVFITQCANFNQPITLGVNVQNINGMLQYCTNFNSVINFLPATNLNDISFTFSGCANFNLPVTIPAKTKQATGTFAYCSNFNSTVTFPSKFIVEKGTYVNMNNMFQSCNNFNTPLTINLATGNISYMFASCRNLNCPITFVPDENYTLYFGHTNGLYTQCYNLNLPLSDLFPNPSNFPEGKSLLKIQLDTFKNCNNFNQNLDLANYGGMDMRAAFQGCVNLAPSYITFPEKWKNFQNMFTNDKNLFKSLRYTILPNSTTSGVNIAGMFYNCFTTGMEGINIRLMNTKDNFFYSKTSFTGFVGSTLADAARPRVNIYVNYVSTTHPFIAVNNANSIVGKAVTWEPTSQGFFNSQYNVYVLDDSLWPV